MKYCRVCVLPDSRPSLKFDANGNCNCARAADKDAIDWEHRAAAFRELVQNAKSRSSGWDCVIPVSGGKDSTWQVAKCLEAGLKPLAVTWRPPGRTSIGQANLENLIRLGVDHIDFSVNPTVEKRFTYKALKKYGTNALPMHMAIFAIPTQVAVKFKIPLVIWGENSAFEYGGADDVRQGFSLNRKWLLTHGVTHGTTAEDWIGEDLSASDMAPYRWPTDDELSSNGVRAIFLGYYLRWDPETTFREASAHGFKHLGAARTGLYEYADIDDDFISIHHWLKWYKFGFTRTYDNLSLEIRNGRVSREEAIAKLRERGDETPIEDIRKFCAWLGITEQHFFEVIEPFRNKSIWKQRDDGKWVIPEFLISDWNWR